MKIKFIEPSSYISEEAVEKAIMFGGDISDEDVRIVVTGNMYEAYYEIDGERKHEVGFFVSQKFAVCSFQQTGADSYCVQAENQFDDFSAAIKFYHLRKRAEDWADNRSYVKNEAPENSSDQEKEDAWKEKLNQAAGDFAPFVWWNYERGKYRSPGATAIIRNRVTHIQEIWV